MVLTKNQVEVKPKGYLEKREYNSFMVLDTNSILYPDELELFGYSVEILNMIRVVLKANKMCSDFKSEFRIKTDIYYKAINSILNNIPFSTSELEAYFENEQQKETFLTFSRSLADIENEFYIPFEIDFILLGMDIDLYNKLDNDEKETLHESYGDIRCDMTFKKMEIKEFIPKAKKIGEKLFKHLVVSEVDN